MDPKHFASQNKKRRGKKPWQQRQLQPRQSTSFKPHFRPQPTNLGYFGNIPSLDEMKALNKQRTRSYFRDGPRQKFRRPPRSTPKSIPRAPEHPANMHFPADNNPLVTPAPETAAFQSATDKLEAEGLNSGLDFYGTNEGVLNIFQNRPADSASEQSELEAPSGDEVDLQHAAGQPLAARLAEQEAYIANLEDENLRLRERLEMLQQELQDIRSGQDVEHADSGSALSLSSEEQSVAHASQGALIPGDGEEAEVEEWSREMVPEGVAPLAPSSWRANVAPRCWSPPGVPLLGARPEELTRVGWLTDNFQNAGH